MPLAVLTQSYDAVDVLSPTCSKEQQAQLYLNTLPCYAREPVPDGHQSSHLLEY